MLENIELEDAQEILMDKAWPSGESIVPLLRATGRVLSQDIRAARNIPPYNKAALDGYALIADDTRNASADNPAKMTVINEVRFGGPLQHPLEAGTAVKIMTGAPVPKGADAIIKYEDIEQDGKEIFVLHPVKSGANIIAIGEDVTRDDLIATKGTLITSPLVAILGGLGMHNIPVFSTVTAAILSVGDELLDPYEPGKICSSSQYGLMARCYELGAKTVNLYIVQDEAEITASRIDSGLSLADIVVCTGGVSVSEYDVLKKALYRIGAEIIFWKIAIRPGSPVVAAVKDGKLIIGLSGNPAAAMVVFDMLVLPVIKKMMGMNHPLPGVWHGQFADNYMKANPKRRLLQANLQRTDGGDSARLSILKGKGALTSMLNYNLLIDIPAGSGPIKAGQEVTGFLVGNIHWEV